MDHPGPPSPQQMLRSIKREVPEVSTGPFACESKACDSLGRVKSCLAPFCLLIMGGGVHFRLGKVTFSRCGTKPLPSSDEFQARQALQAPIYLGPSPLFGANGSEIPSPQAEPPNPQGLGSLAHFIATMNRCPPLPPHLPAALWCHVLG